MLALSLSPSLSLCLCVCSKVCVDVSVHPCMKIRAHISLGVSGICLYKAVLFLLLFLWGHNAIVSH